MRWLKLDHVSKRLYCTELYILDKYTTKECCSWYGIEIVQTERLDVDQKLQGNRIR